mgnify:CR=1 FL=1
MANPIKSLELHYPMIYFFIIHIGINLLVVYCESVNLIGYITVDYLLIVSPN